MIPMTLWKKRETVVRDDVNEKELKLPSTHLSSLSVGCSYHSRGSSEVGSDFDSPVSPTENTFNGD